MLIKYSHLATASIKKQKSAMKLDIQAMNPIIPAKILTQGHRHHNFKWLEERCGANNSEINPTWNSNPKF